MTKKLTASEYIRLRRDILNRIQPEEFIRADNYMQAAGRITTAIEVRVCKETILSLHEVALRLCELYPDGMPLTFVQLAEMTERGLAVPPDGAVAE